MSENLPEPSEVSENSTYTLPDDDPSEVGDDELADGHIVADIEGTEGSEL